MHLKLPELQSQTRKGAGKCSIYFTPKLFPLLNLNQIKVRIFFLAFFCMVVVIFFISIKFQIIYGAIIKLLGFCRVKSAALCFILTIFFLHKLVGGFISYETGADDR